MGTLLIDKLLQTVVHPEGQRPAPDRGQSSRCSGCTATCGRWRPRCSSRPTPSALMKSITPERCQQELQEVGGTDFGFAFGEMARFRVAVFKQRGNIGLVLRRIPNEFLTFEQLGLPAVIEQLIQRPRGLILVTGPTGSGKTTSLASMINWINDNMDRHIITIEDPIEYFHKHKKSLVNQREIGIDVPDFPEAIRRALRMDPDIILVGEMRDLATISGGDHRGRDRPHRLRHPAHQLGRGDRQPDHRRLPQGAAGPDPHPALGGDHRHPGPGPLPRKPKGLVAAYEMLVVTPAISNLIRENKTYRIDSSIQTGRKHGMILLDDSLFNLWRQGLVEEEEVMYKSRKPNDLRERIENAKKGIFDDERARRTRRSEPRPARHARPGVTRGRSGRNVVRCGYRVSRRLASDGCQRPGRAGGPSSGRSARRLAAAAARLRRSLRRRGPFSAGAGCFARRSSQSGTVTTSRGDSSRCPRGPPRRVAVRHGAPTRHDPGGHGLPRRGEPLEGPRGAEAVRAASCSARWPSGWAWSRKTRCSRRSASSSA